jgi:hypothetical protein
VSVLCYWCIGCHVFPPDESLLPQPYPVFQHDGLAEYPTDPSGSAYALPVVNTLNRYEQTSMNRVSQPLHARNLSDPSAQLSWEQRIQSLSSAGNRLPVDVLSHQDGGVRIANGPPLSVSKRPHADMVTSGSTENRHPVIHVKSAVPISSTRAVQHTPSQGIGASQVGSSASADAGPFLGPLSPLSPLDDAPPAYRLH